MRVAAARARGGTLSPTSTRPVYSDAYGLAVTGLDGTSGVLVGTTVLEGDSVRAAVDASLLDAHLVFEDAWSCGGKVSFTVPLQRAKEDRRVSERWFLRYSLIRRPTGTDGKC